MYVCMCAYIYIIHIYIYCLLSLIYSMNSKTGGLIGMFSSTISICNSLSTAHNTQLTPVHHDRTL